MTLKGSTSEFPLDVLLRLLADTKKTGELALRGQKGEGALGLAEGRVTTAMYAEEKPIPALGFIWEIGAADFEFTPWNDAPPANLEGSLEENLKRADEYAKWRADVRSVIPHDGVRFRLSERAADQGAVTFTADRWRVVMAVNTRPSVSELASNLHIDRDDALTTLAGLVRDGVIETTDEPAPTPTAKPVPGPPPAAEMTSAPAYTPVPEPAPAPPPPEPEVTQAAPAEDWTAALVRRAETQAEPEIAHEQPREESAPAQSASTDVWSAMPAAAAPAPEPPAAAPLPDWTGAPAAPAAQWTPTPIAPAAQDWSAVPQPPPAPEAPAPMAPPPDWSASPMTHESSPQPWTAAPPPPPDWTSSPAASQPAPSAPAPAQPSWSEPAPYAPPAAEAWTQPTESSAAPSASEWAPAQPAQQAEPAGDWATAKPAEPAPLDDRLAALQGLFNTPAPAQSEPAQPWTAPAADTWTTPQQAAPAPAAPAPAEDPRLAAMSAPPAAAPQKETTPSEWAPPPAVGAPQQKKGGLFGGLFGGRKSSSAAEGASASNGGSGSRAGKLAAFSNALLSEYTSGSYGKGKVDDRMPSLLMRVDEQADPIDRPLPVVDDRLDVQALERVQIAENQAVPYLATLVSTIFADAEKAFGKDKAKRGYKAAQQQIFGADAAALSGPDVAGKLPKI